MFRRRVPLLALLLLGVGTFLWAVLASSARAERPVATDLRVNGQVHSLALDTLPPRFTWIPVDADRGASQTAYQIQVASSPGRLLSDAVDLWDSGKVVSSKTLYIPYGGGRLASASQYAWRVRLWDETGVGPWSSPASFATGPLGADWTASWIWEATSNENDFCYLRKSFQLSAPVSQARIHVFACDEYRLFVNGTEVGAGPAPSDPFRSAYYDTFDIASLLREGENVFAALAHSVGVRGGPRVFSPAAFLVQSDISLGPAGTVRVVSDASWRVLSTTPFDETAPTRGPSYASATSVEDFDARSEPIGWRTTAFDDSAWQIPTIRNPGFKLKSRTVPARETIARIPPVSITEPAPGVFLVDFGENRSGWPELTLHRISSGTRIVFWYSEEVAGGRIVRNRGGITDNWDAYTAAGRPTEWFAPDTGYNGMRYLEIEGLPAPPLPADLRFQAVSTLVDRPGFFRSSDPTYNAIEDISIRTQENVTQGVLIDGPQRQQTQLSGDAFIQFQNHAYLSRDMAQATRFLRDFADSDLGDGVLTACAPSSAKKVIPEWTLYWVLAVPRVYEFSGDSKILTDYFPTVVSLLASLDVFRDPSTDLLTNVPGAVYAWGRLDTSGAARTPMNCLYVRALDVAAKMASILGRSPEEAHFRGIAGRVREGIQRHLFDGVRRYRDSLGSNQFHLASSVLPLAFGITPAPIVPSVLAGIESSPHAPDSPPAAYHLFEYLRNHDRETALHALLASDSEQWGRMLSQGATTTWEVWRPDFSRCHGWTAFPTQILPSAVAGIRPLSPGFKTFGVRPHLGSLAEVDALVPSVRGDIRAHWKTSRGHVELFLDVPANTTARVDLPRSGMGQLQVRESGTIVFSDDAFRPGVAGVSYAGIDLGYLSLDVGAGHYHFGLDGIVFANSGPDSPSNAPKHP